MAECTITLVEYSSLSKYIGNWIGSVQANALKKAGIKNAKVADSATSNLRTDVEELRKELAKLAKPPLRP